MPVISLIVAASTNNVIGVRGRLPWRLRGDLQYFKSVTMGKPIIMGRKTYASIGRALPGRQNIVMTRQADFAAAGCTVVVSQQAALAAAAGAAEIMVIGGGQLYELFLPQAQRIYLTRVHTEVDGDAFFPALDDAVWQLTAEEQHEADEHNAHAFVLQRYERMRQSSSASDSRSANS